MVSEPDFEVCAKEEAEPRKGVDTSRCANEDVSPEEEWTSGCVPARTLGFEGGWIVRSHIGGEENKTFLVRM